MVTIEIPCRYCSQAEFVKRNGKARSGLQRYRCTDSRRSFQYEYLSRGHAPGTAEKIIETALNGSGVRGISRVLKVSINTVISHLKNSHLRK